MKEWSLRKKITREHTELVDHYPEIVSQALFYRGVTTVDEANKFFNPKYEDALHDPFLMKDMMKAALRIVAAINNQERIVVYADYDCDGIPAATILHDLFKKIEFNNFEVYIPHRQNEGYGVNIGSVRELCSRGADLFITVDCGITDFEAAGEAKQLGADFIITDHHETKETLPDAFAIVNPKRKDDNYPCKMLSGSGVAFKLAQAIVAVGNFNIREGWEKWLLDMASLGTVADMVPLQGENRAIAQFGLSVLRKTRRPGLQNLYYRSRIDPASLTEEDIGFAIAPRINAASRIGVPSVAFTFVSTDEHSEAVAAFNYLENKNTERKSLVDAVIREAREMANASDRRELLLIGREGWNPGILGLVAGRLSEEYKKTVFCWGGEGGCLKGSCRSDGSVSLVDLMSKLPEEIFSEFGGHHLAGGFSIKKEALSFAEEKLCRAYSDVLDEKLAHEIIIDQKIGLEEVSWDLYNMLEKMAPFGIGNPRPIFFFQNVEVDSLKKFGKKGDHLQIELRKKDNNTISAYDFFKNESSFPGVYLRRGSLLDLAATIEKNNFGRRPSLRLRIVDIK
jgi:single-stranded-DNA-specific exonuclease